MHRAEVYTYKPEATGSTQSSKSWSTKFSEALSTVMGEIDDEDESEVEWYYHSLWVNLGKALYFTAMNLLFLLNLNLNIKISKAECYVLICSLILPILWLLSIVLSNYSKKRRILTMNRKILEMTNDNDNHSDNNINFEFKSKIKRNNIKSCRNI